MMAQTRGRHLPVSPVERVSAGRRAGLVPAGEISDQRGAVVLVSLEDDWWLEAIVEECKEAMGQPIEFEVEGESEAVHVFVDPGAPLRRRLNVAIPRICNFAHGVGNAKDRPHLGQGSLSEKRSLGLCSSTDSGW